MTSLSTQKSRWLAICYFLLVAIAIISMSTSHATGNAVYIAQTAAGSANGADCADAVAYSYFNSSGNWSATPTGIQIGPATTVHLCGTINGTNTANTNVLVTQGAGSSGSPVTVHFEAGAVVQSPACAYNGCIVVNHNYVTVDGGTNGTIENTSDGLSGNTACLIGTCTVQQAATLGIELNGTNDIVENLNVSHMCMHTFQASDNFFFQPCGAIQMNGANDLATQNTIDNTATGVGGGASGLEISYNTMAVVNHAITIGASASQVWSGIKIHNNDVSQEWPWDAADNSYHHNGIIIEVVGTGGQVPGLQIYDNYFHGLWSNDNIYGDSHITNAIFLDTNSVADSIPNAYIVRNILEFDTSPCVASGSGTCPGGVGKNLNYPTGGFTAVGGCTTSPCSPPNQSLIANNTMIGGGTCWQDGDVNNTPSVLNNLCATLGGAILSWPSHSPYVISGSGTIDYNLYAGTGTSNAFSVPTTTCPPALCGNPFANINSWTAWHNTPYFLDQHCTPSSTPPGTGSSCNPSLSLVALTSSYRLNSGSVAIGAAANLTSAWCTTIPALCVGAPSTFGRGGANDGVALPITGNWDTGAYPSGSPSTVATPTFSPVAGTYTAAQSVTISTVTSGATICYTTDGSTPTANGAGTCTHGTTYSSPVSIAVTETLKAVGSEAGFSDSSVGSAAYTITPVAPSPATGMFAMLIVNP